MFSISETLFLKKKNGTKDKEIEKNDKLEQYIVSIILGDNYECLLHWTKKVLAYKNQQNNCTGPLINLISYFPIFGVELFVCKAWYILSNYSQNGSNQL